MNVVHGHPRSPVHAAYINRLGPPSVIHYGELPAPAVGPADVLVAVTVTSVNRVDTFVRSGGYPTPLPFPFIVGRDLAGVVAQVGKEVRGFQLGDRVWCNSLGHNGRQGAAADRVSVPADRLYQLPGGVSPNDAVAVAHPAATAYLGLFVHGRTRVGDVVVVVGAAGNVGSAAVVQAARAGARVLAVAADRDAEYCRRLGARDVFDYRDPGWAAQVRRAAPSGVDVYLDACGENELGRAVELSAVRGRIILLAGADSSPVLPVGPLYMKDGSVRGFAISRASVHELADAAATINELLADGLLSARAVQTFPLDSAGAVHRRVEREGAHGTRFLLRPQFSSSNY